MAQHCSLLLAWELFVVFLCTEELKATLECLCLLCFVLSSCYCLHVAQKFFLKKQNLKQNSKLDFKKHNLVSAFRLREAESLEQGSHTGSGTQL